MPIKGVFGLPFKEQEEFFQRKLHLPTERWDDIKQAAHDRAFMVAGALKADLLADLHGAIVAAKTGGGLEDFRARFEEIVARHGWTGWTGEDTPAGRAWRTRVIYETNLYTSYAAGRYRQLADSPNLRYWMYKHDPLVATPREQHLAWDGLILPRDHPFWQTHFPPNGWGCRCRVVGVERPEDAAAIGGDPDKTLPDGWDAIDARTGAPKGIGKGWGYAPGANADTTLREMVQDKLIGYTPAIAQALTRDVNRWIDARTDVADFAIEMLRERGVTKDLWIGFVENPAIVQLVDRNLSGYLMLLPADGIRHAFDSHEFDGAGQRSLQPVDYANAARWLADGEVVLGDTVRGMARVVARYPHGNEVIESVWEVRPGKRNRALALVTAWVNG